MPAFQIAGSPVTIRQEDPAQADIIAMLERGEEHSASLYPAESNHHLALEALRHPDICFFVARDQNDLALATGALVLNGDWAEIKRMWVEEPARGFGLSRRMLEALIARARAAGIKVLRLETGVASHAALALYERAGFTRREPFADYRPDPLSVFMERML
jgi:putative acetyltransferase